MNDSCWDRYGNQKLCTKMFIKIILDWANHQLRKWDREKERERERQRSKFVGKALLFIYLCESILYGYLEYKFIDLIFIMLRHEIWTTNAAEVSSLPFVVRFLCLLCIIKFWRFSCHFGDFLECQDCAYVWVRKKESEIEISVFLDDCYILMMWIAFYLLRHCFIWRNKNINKTDNKREEKKILACMQSK